MDKKVFTVDEVSKILGMHPRTIRRYIREDKLKAGKIGGQWRIKKKDLTKLMDDEDYIESKKIEVTNNLRGFVEDNFNKVEGKIKVCSIVDVYVESIEELKPITNVLMDLINSEDSDRKTLKFEYIFLDEENKARFTLWGNPKFISKMIKAISDFE
ncbi:helix-turn-helix domain-containing protein [Dethiothermospora halolimnae]|uniref:helix-turn-helix domain-containing protein n=1 Tax=Dethiothermospora halolimnae TaxID=3114390 RepID=UPI003CCBE702